MPVAPANSTLIQVGFNYGLNYPFVVNTENSASQVFTYLPQGLAYTLGIPEDKVVMNALMPFSGSSTLNYIMTLGQAYIPENLVNQLQLDLHTPMSMAYQNPNGAVNSLMTMINPTIAIIPGNTVYPDGTNSADNPAGTSYAIAEGAAPIGSDSGTSQSVKGTSVAIGAGSVAGAAVYCAAMVYIARRYRNKRRGHLRVSSLPTVGEMSQRSMPRSAMGGYFMVGGAGNGRYSAGSSSSSSGRSGRNSRSSAGSGSHTGRSVREQGISAPLNSENSLGWN